jgi:predicted ester cyclase
MRRSIVFVVLLFVLVVGAGSIVTVAQDEAVQANKDAVQIALTDFNSGNPETLFNLFPEQFMMNQGGTALEPMSKSDVEGFNLMLLDAIPDLQIIPNVILGQGDWVVAQTTYTGTFTNALFFGVELAPTHESVVWTEMNFMHFEDGLVIENWSTSDPMVMFSQLGMFPPQEDEEDLTIPLESPVGYQTLSADELTASYTSGMEARNLAVFQELLDLGLGTDDSAYYADTYLSWHGGTAVEYIADVQVEEDMAFTGMIAAALPDYVINTPVIVAEGDWVATLADITGTFTEDTNFFGTPLTATGEPVSWQIGILYHYSSDGKIIEIWNETDTTSLFVGLGLMSMDEE